VHIKAKGHRLTHIECIILLIEQGKAWSLTLLRTSRGYSSKGRCSSWIRSM